MTTNITKWYNLDVEKISHLREVKEMKKFDYRKVLESGKVYECGRSTKTGRVYLFYVENGIKRLYAFDDIMHDGCLSKQSYFVTPEQMILEITSINFINFETGYVHFTGRVKFE